MRTIELTQGKVAIVDDWNFEWLNQFKWCAMRDKSGRWYAGRTARPNGKQKTLYMARVIMGVTDPKVQVDHKDREATLDNREDNLRLATNALNGCNKDSSRNTSGFRGVVFKSGKRLRPWQSAIKVNSKSLHLGYFNTAVEAAAVYNFAAKRLHGEFAVLNDLSQV